MQYARISSISPRATLSMNWLFLHCDSIKYLPRQLVSDAISRNAISYKAAHAHYLTCNSGNSPEVILRNCSYTPSLYVQELVIIVHCSVITYYLLLFFVAAGIYVETKYICLLEIFTKYGRALCDVLTTWKHQLHTNWRQYARCTLDILDLLLNHFFHSINSQLFPHFSVTVPELELEQRSRVIVQIWV